MGCVLAIYRIQNPNFKSADTNGRTTFDADVWLDIGDYALEASKSKNLQKLSNSSSSGEISTTSKSDKCLVQNDL